MPECVMFPDNCVLMLTVFSLYLLNPHASETTVTEESLDATLNRSRRQLLFPNTTLLQLTLGIGTPTLAKMINMNWGFQLNFQLPWNRSQVPVDIFFANSGYGGESRSERDVNKIGGSYENDASLYHFYNYVEETVNSFGHNGSTCVLQALCQIAAEPLHSDDEEDLLHELATFVLDPTNDIVQGVIEIDERYRYIDAYHHGRRGYDCFRKYENCTMPLLEMFTKIHDFD